MNFDELFNYCAKLNESTNEKCLVCHIPIQNTDKHLKLQCSHYYHPECIKYTKGTIKCLYCEKISIPTIIQAVEDNVCAFLMKSGKNKGNKCGRINCKYHVIKENTNMCNIIIKTGVRAGDSCNRILPCKYHNCINL